MRENNLCDTFGSILVLMYVVAFISQPLHLDDSTVHVVYGCPSDHASFSFNPKTKSFSLEINSEASLKYLPLRWLAPEVRQRLLKALPTSGRSFRCELECASENIWSLGITLVGGVLGCVILPKVIGIIDSPLNPIIWTTNSSPSEKF